MKIFAITSDGTPVVADLYLNIIPGSGEIWSNVTPLVGTTTQSAEKTAVKVARNYFSAVDEYDYLFDIDSTASAVEGPSAGAAMALLTISMLKDMSLSEEVSITGTVTDEARVGNVGGVFQKTSKAAEEGITLFMIPRGEAKQIIREEGSVKNIDLIDHAFEEWGVKVVEVDSIDEVLEIAFSEWEEIDINKGAVPEKQFSPKPITFGSELQPMHDITANIISETKVRIEEARKSMETTAISDQAEISFLLSTLNLAEQSLQETEAMFENNYLYSAANNAFIAKIYASMVKDIADNPSLLQSDSEVFKMKVNDLRKNIQGLKANLDRTVPIDLIEWHIAAQQRLAWAMNNIDEITGEKVLVVDVTTGEISEAETIKKIQDYEFAVSWFEAAREFHARTTESNAKVRKDDAFKEFSSNYIVNTENGLSIAEGEELEDAGRRLNAAKKEQEMGWYLATAFDSASSFALIDSYIKLKDKDFSEIHSMLKEKIGYLEGEMGKEKKGIKKFVWSRLYLDHAKYYYDSSEFYYNEGYGSKAIEQAKSGFNLVLLAENLFNVSNEIYIYYEQFSPDDYVTEGGLPELERKYQFTETFDQQAFARVISLFVILLFIVMMEAVILTRVYSKKKYSMEGQMHRLMSLQRRIDTAFSEGKISGEKHDELTSRYKKQMDVLNKEISFRSKHAIEIDRLRVEFAAREKALRDLKILRGKKLIKEEDYKKAIDKYRLDEFKLKKRAELAEKELKDEKVPSAEEIISLINEEKQLEKTKKKKSGKKK